MKKYSHGCTLDCFDACKLNVYSDNNKVIKIEGDKDHPYTKGFICKKGLAHLDRLYHEKRIYKPLLKVNGQWKEITFEEAVNIVANKLTYYKEKYSCKSVLYYEQYGNGAVLKSIGEVFLNFYGGYLRAKGGPCWSAGIAAQTLDFGDVRSHRLEDMCNSKSIFIWGKNPAFTTVHTIKAIKDAKKSGSRVIVIDPIFTETAKSADKYVKVKAGGDRALALAMGKVIIKKGLSDNDYIDNYVKGFKEYKYYVDSLNIENLSQQCGVSVEEIEELATIYAEKYSTILLGYGLQKYSNGGETIRAIDVLGAITGQIGFSGGGINYANKVYGSVLNSDPYNSEDYSDNKQYYTSHISDIIRESNEGVVKYKNNIFVPSFRVDNKEEYEEVQTPVKMAIITKSNLMNQLPKLGVLREAFNKVEFKVCFDMFLTDTAEVCDLFIPTTSTLESEDLLYSSMTNPYIIYNEKTVEPKHELMDEYAFFMAVAKKMNLEDYPMVDKKTYLSKVIEPLREYFEDISLDKIRDEYLTIHKPIPWENKKFETKSGKFEIADFSKSDENNGIDKKVWSDKRAFRLLTNHSRDSLSSQHYIDKDEISKAYINSNVANTLQIKTYDKVKLISDNGSITVEAIIDDNISNDIVMMYVGWWNKSGNPNDIAESGISDIGGQVTYNETFIDVKKVL